jgi:hypothetical protein
MSDEQSTESKNLQKVERLTPAIFEQKKITKLITDVKREVLSLVPDASTEKGRKEVKSLAYKVARSKTTLDNMGKEHVASIKEQAKEVDTCRKQWRDAMDDLKSSVLAPVTEYEEREAARVEAIEQKLQKIKDLAHADDAGYFYTAAQLEERKAILMAMEVDASFEEFEEKAHAQWGYALRTLDTLIAGARAKEAEEEAARKAEEERQRKAQEERDQRIREEAAEQARREEREKAERERQQERERIEQAALREKQAREQTEAKAAADEAKRQAQAEQEKADAERKAQAEKDEEERRRRNTQHRGKVNKAAMEALMESAGLDEAAAKKAVTAIVKGQVPAVSITY